MLVTLALLVTPAQAADGALIGAAATARQLGPSPRPAVRAAGVAGVLIGRWEPGLIDCLGDQPAWRYTPVLQADLTRGVPVLPRDPASQGGALVLARSVEVCPWAPHARGAMVDDRRYRDEGRRRSGLPLGPGADKAP